MSILLSKFSITDNKSIRRDPWSLPLPLPWVYFASTNSASYPIFILFFFAKENSETHGRLSRKGYMRLEIKKGEEGVTAFFCFMREGEHNRIEIYRGCVQRKTKDKRVFRRVSDRQKAVRTIVVSIAVSSERQWADSGNNRVQKECFSWTAWEMKLGSTRKKHWEWKILFVHSTIVICASAICYSCQTTAAHTQSRPMYRANFF